MEEIWVDIKDHEGLYKINIKGQVKSMAKSWVCGFNSVRHKEETILKICTSTEYDNLRLHKKGQKSKFVHLHRLLAQHFIPNPENKREVNHINGDKHDNRIENLEWVTSSENRQHAFNTGLKKSPKGVNHWNAKPLLVIFIKEVRSIIFPTMSQAIKEAGIGQTTIWSNMNGVNKSRKYIFEFV